MKILAWYAIVSSTVTILAFLLTMLKVIPPPPFTVLEDIVWMVAIVPILLLGIWILIRPE
jgi:hypothetical protein